MNPDYAAVLRGIRELHLLALAGRDGSPEADRARDAIDAPWRRLTDAERAGARAFSERLWLAAPADAP